MLTPFIIDRAVIFNDSSQNKKHDVIYRFQASSLN